MTFILVIQKVPDIHYIVKYTHALTYIHMNIHIFMDFCFEVL